MIGGFTALIATKILGARRGRFHDDRGRPLRKPNDIPGHSVALQMLGCFLLWFGWYAFNAGITIMVGVSDRSQIVSLIAANTSLSAGMGGISALFVNLFVMERLTGESVFDLRSAMNGMLAGAVSITGACGLVEPWAAVVIGSISGVFYLLGHHALLKLRIDDVVDASPGE
jgi:Amt family ammonium transporter